MKILDCTLRDGGYYTNWEFDDDFVITMLESLSMSGVNIVELGYKSPVKGGHYRKCNDKFITNILNKAENAYSMQYAFMVDVKDFIQGGHFDSSLFNSLIKDSHYSPFSICRVAIKHNEVDHAGQIVENLLEKGYEVIVNLMTISILSSEEIDSVLSKLKKLNISAVYFADSYGNLTPGKAVDLVGQFKRSGKQVGVHAHDNCGLAFANSVAAKEAGATYIDSTLLGMGRGSGNLKTEQILQYLSNDKNHYYPIVLEPFLQHKMQPLIQKHGWGFSTNYMLAGLNNIHPLYVQNLQQSHLSNDQIQHKINHLPNKTKFVASDIEKILKPTVAVVIPARYESSRFPGKPLAKINGLEMIIHVANIATGAVGPDSVYVATDNNEIADLVTTHGYNCVMTSDSCLTGTDRIAEAALEIDADIIINLQGDEPLVDFRDIQKVIQAKIDNFDKVINCYAPIHSKEDLTNVNVPKVVMGENGQLLYASRSPIPGNKTTLSGGHRQVCIYAFSKEELKRFASDKKLPLESEEDIEILRFLELGIPVKMIECADNSAAVDIPEDIAKIEKLLND